MADNKEQGSEVTRLLRQISAEYEAAQQGLSGLALGVSQHRFITQRMERIHDLHCQLHALVGDEAIVLVATHQDQLLPANHAAQSLVAIAYLPSCCRHAKD